jgi:hypothetical protein
VVDRGVHTHASSDDDITPTNKEEGTVAEGFLTEDTVVEICRSFGSGARRYRARKGPSCGTF